MSSSSKHRSVVKHPPPWGSATKSISRSSSAMLVRWSPELAVGPGAIVANCSTSGWTQASEVGASPVNSSPPLKPKRRLVAALRPSHFTYDFQARAFYERSGYSLVGRVSDFPSGTDVLWYRKPLQPVGRPVDPGVQRRELADGDVRATGPADSWR